MPKESLKSADPAKFLSREAFDGLSLDEQSAFCTKGGRISD
jgi:hypothetical protein